MKLKGTRGMQNIPRIRLSGGMYSRVKEDGLVIFSKRPDQPETNDPNSQFNRDQMRVSAWLVNQAIPIEVEAAKNFAVNSNYTYKDALTAAQFGALFKIVLADGTEFHPADHSYQGEQPPDTGMSAYTTLGAYLAATGLPVANFDCVIPSGITDVIVIFNRVTGTVASTLGIRVSTDGGTTFKSGAADYENWSTAALPANNSFIPLTPTASSNFCSGVAWFPAIHVGNAATVMLDVCYNANSGIYKGSTAAVNAIRVFRTAGSLSGDSAMFILVMGR